MLSTTLVPIQLFRLCKEIERKLGRRTNRRTGELGNWGERKNRRIGELENRRKKESRTIDLDILFYGNKILKTRKLTIPHPLLHKRYFVMIPLMEIAPDFIHPVFKKTVRVIHELPLHPDKHKKLGKCSIKV